MAVAASGYLRIGATDVDAWMGFGTGVLGLMEAGAKSLGTVAGQNIRKFVPILTMAVHMALFVTITAIGKQAISLVATRNTCTHLIFPFQFFMMVFFICPNSDAYLAQKYPSEFSAYAAATATYIPGLHSPVLSKGLAWVCLALAMWMEMNCGVACGLT